MAALTTQQEALAFQRINALPLVTKQRLWDAMNRILDKDPNGNMIRQRARTRTMGLSGGLGDWGTALATGITALATTAATVGLAVYDKRKDTSAQSSADQDAMQVALAQVQANAPAKQQTSHVLEYSLFGVGGLALLGLIFWGVSRGRR